MTPRRLGSLGAVVAGAVMLAGVASAHIPPPVVLMSDRDAVVALLAGAQRFFVREVRLSPAEQAVIKRQTGWTRSEEHTSELQSLAYLVCRLLLEKKKKNNQRITASSTTYMRSHDI